MPWSGPGRVCHVYTGLNYRSSLDLTDTDIIDRQPTCDNELTLTRQCHGMEEYCLSFSKNIQSNTNNNVNFNLSTKMCHTTMNKSLAWSVQWSHVTTAMTVHEAIVPCHITQHSVTVRTVGESDQLSRVWLWTESEAERWDTVFVKHSIAFSISQISTET